MSTLELAVHQAVSSVDDPEYPGISIVDLGLLETLAIADSGVVQIGLIPTFAGCPALDLIRADVAAAVEGVDGIAGAEVVWLSEPVWDISRVSLDARQTLADEFTVAVKLGERTPLCPLCGSPTAEQSAVGPSRCRSIHQCTSCNEPVEVMRSL